VSGRSVSCAELVLSSICDSPKSTRTGTGEDIPRNPTPSSLLSAANVFGPEAWIADRWGNQSAYQGDVNRSRHAMERVSLRPAFNSRYSRTENSLPVSSIPRPLRSTCRCTRSSLRSAAVSTDSEARWLRRTSARLWAESSLKEKGLARQSSAPVSGHGRRSFTRLRCFSTSTGKLGFSELTWRRTLTPSSLGRFRP
jgi:hypothetical protein